MAIKRVPLIDDEEADVGPKMPGFESYAARLLTQGKHRFYTLAMPSDVLAQTCVVETRDKNGIEGFQRILDETRAQEIADYIDSGFGTIPTSIVVSAQPEAQLVYTSKNQVLRFKKIPKAFLILDGQHRVYGFQKAASRLRVPVVIYNGLTRSEEARLFIDINTKQRPVPNELLLDIRRMAESETDELSAMREIFDLFDSDASSPLLGLMSKSSRQKGKISRVTFNAALGPIWHVLSPSDPHDAYAALSAYLHAWKPVLRDHDAEQNITNSTLLRALMLLFPMAAEKVALKHGEAYSSSNFHDALTPLFSKVRKQTLKAPGAKPIALAEDFKKLLQSGFTIKSAR